MTNELSDKIFDILVDNMDNLVSIDEIYNRLNKEFEDYSYALINNTCLNIEKDYKNVYCFYLSTYNRKILVLTMTNKTKDEVYENFNNYDYKYKNYHTLSASDMKLDTYNYLKHLCYNEYEYIFDISNNVTESENVPMFLASYENDRFNLIDKFIKKYPNIDLIKKNEFDETCIDVAIRCKNYKFLTSVYRYLYEKVSSKNKQLKTKIYNDKMYYRIIGFLVSVFGFYSMMKVYSVCF